MNPDIKVQGHGSIFLLRGVSAAGMDWIDEYVSRTGYQPSSNYLVVEHRYIEAIVFGAIADGLAVAA